MHKKLQAKKAKKKTVVPKKKEGKVSTIPDDVKLFMFGSYSIGPLKSIL